MAAITSIDLKRTLCNAMFVEESASSKPGQASNTLTLMFGGSSLDTADELIHIHNIHPELGRLLEMLVKKYEKE